MDFERESLVIDSRAKTTTESRKLPYIKSKESLSQVNSADRSLSVDATGSTSATPNESAALQFGDGNGRANTVVKRPNNLVPFEPLDEEGERYLREHLILPPIEEFSGTKYYMNLALTECDISSANSVNEWWEFLDYDSVCCVSSRGEQVMHNKQQSLEEVTIKENASKKRHFLITKKTITERKLNNRNTQENVRAQIISDLGKQMVSLYSLKVISY